jgi:hypothetical protein
MSTRPCGSLGPISASGDLLLQSETRSNSKSEDGAVNRRGSGAVAQAPEGGILG